MKKIILAICTISLVCSCTETKKPEGNLHLTGNIKGLQMGTIYVKKIQDSSLVTIDSIKIDGDSHFESYLNVTEPEVHYLLLDRGTTSSLDNSLPFFAEAGNMTIETNVDKFYADAKITGSKNQKLLEDYRKVSARYNDQRLSHVEEQFWSERNSKSAKVDSLQQLQDKILKRQYLYAINFVVQNGDKEVAPFVALTEIPNIQPKYRNMIQDKLTPKIKNSIYGKKLLSVYAELDKLDQ